MTTFPALVPSSAPLTPGAWPMTPTSSINGAESRISHGSAEIGRECSLTFTNITEADFLAILNHYREQRSGFDSFGFSTTTLAAALTPAGFAWLYADKPQVVDDHADCFTVTCRFRCEPRGLVVARGAMWRSLTTLAPGARDGGVVYGASRAWVTSSTTLIPGMGPDPYFSSVALLLHMDGTNGSTTFTDDSSNAHTMSVNDGTVTIGTAQSKFGGAAADFTSGGDLRTPTSSAFTFAGDFTIEMWARRTGATGSYDTLLSAKAVSGNDSLLLLRAGGVNAGFFSTFQQFATGFALTLDTWQHVAMVRADSTVTAYVDGSSIGTVTESSTITCDFLAFGDSTAASGRYFKGLVDEIRVSQRARYLAPFTPSDQAFRGGS